MKQPVYYAIKIIGNNPPSIVLLGENYEYITDIEVSSIFEYCKYLNNLGVKRIDI